MALLFPERYESIREHIIISTGGTMAIPVNIYGKDIVVTERIKDYVEKKFGKLDHHLDLLEDVRVELKHNATVRRVEDKHITQVTVKGRGGVTLRVEERNEDVFTSIDSALDKIERRIEKYKGKQIQKNKQDPNLEESLRGLEMPDVDAEPYAIHRRKRMVLEPMTEKEAMDQMQLLGHEEFFLFQDVSKDKVCVIYRRRDGNFGIIETEIR
jgi:putative sigma-54 modulation protein